MMHVLAAGLVTGSVIKRASQGDCPTEPAHSVETLEETVIEVNRLFQAEQKVRATAEAERDALAAEIAQYQTSNHELMMIADQPARRVQALEAALRGIATNTLNQGSTDERRNEGIKIGLAMAADMARRALESTHPALAQQSETPAKLPSDSCEGCPPIGYPTDETRCTPCPRRSASEPRAAQGDPNVHG